MGEPSFDTTRRVRDAAFDGVLSRRQSLAEHLSSKHLRTANIAAVPTKYVLLDSLQTEQAD